MGYQVVEELSRLGETLGVRTRHDVRVGTEPEDVILEVADRSGIDLIVLGTAVRAGSERLFLGGRVEHILHEARCPVLVVNAV
jgi:nucleotide-binding universal stress UspA family protein